MLLNRDVCISAQPWLSGNEASDVLKLCFKVLCRLCFLSWILCHPHSSRCSSMVMYMRRHAAATHAQQAGMSKRLAWVQRRTLLRANAVRQSSASSTAMVISVLLAWKEKEQNYSGVWIVSHITTKEMTDCQQTHFPKSSILYDIAFPTMLDLP